MAGTIYLVATPIGNLEDITERALRVLRSVDLIACEDTRHTRKLLNHFGIEAKTISYHEHNERERADELIRLAAEGKNIAVVSDAGTPCINDPGYRIVQQAISTGIAVIPLPGPVAFVAALAASGLPTNEVFFGGFLSAKRNQRRQQFENVKNLKSTLAFYEAPHRLVESLKDAREVLGERKAVVARELTKLHEEFARGLLGDLAKQFGESESVRGEIVMVIDREVIADPADDAKVDLLERVEQLERDGMDTRGAMKTVARELGLTRSEAYRRLAVARSRGGE